MAFLHLTDLKHGILGEIGGRIGSVVGHSNLHEREDVAGFAYIRRRPPP